MASQFSNLIAHFKLTEEDCEREVSDTDIVKIASSLHGKWKSQLPPLLGMDPIVVTDIVGAPGYISEEDRRLAFFKEWKQQNGFDSTYKTIISALLEIKCRQDAENVCKILKEATLTASTSQVSASINTNGMPNSPVATTPDVTPQKQSLAASGPSPIATQKQVSTPTTSASDTPCHSSTAAQKQASALTDAASSLAAIVPQSDPPTASQKQIPTLTDIISNLEASVLSSNPPAATQKQMSTLVDIVSSLATSVTPHGPPTTVQKRDIASSVSPGDLPMITRKQTMATFIPSSGTSSSGIIISRDL